jgi:hypothetical protein
MSQIPFVAELGDRLDAAIAQTPAPAGPPARRRRRPRGLLIALAAMLAVGGGVALAAIMSDPQQLAVNGVSCYPSADRDSGVSYDPAGELSPAQRCAGVLGRPAATLVSCDGGHGSVAVFPGSGADACARAGLRALPAGYAAQQKRVRVLQHDVFALEAGADCIAPRELATRVQALLRRSGWTGWRTVLRLDVGSGPCGSATQLDGGGGRSLAGSLDAATHTVMVVGGPPRALVDGLYARGGVAGPLIDASGDRCYGPDDVRALARGRLASFGLPVRFATTRPPADVTIQGARGARLSAGCAIVTDVAAAPDARSLVVTLRQRG